MTLNTIHIGSLPRSQDVVDMIVARANNVPFEQAESVRRQADVGIDMVNDGETSKVGCAAYVKNRYTGLSSDDLRNAPLVLQNDFYTAGDECLALSRHMLFQDLTHDECFKIATARI